MRYSIRKGEGNIHYIYDGKHGRNCLMVFSWVEALKTCRQFNLIWAEYKRVA